MIGTGIRLGLVAGGAAGLVALFYKIPGLVDRFANAVENRHPKRPKAKALADHRKLFVADLHSDALLWDRDLLERHEFGHVDIPRMLEGGVSFQIFTIVTKVPLGFNIHKTHDGPNLITLLSKAQGRRSSTGLLADRVKEQAEKFNSTVRRSKGSFAGIRSVSDFEAFEKRRASGEKVVAGMLGIEGLHALDGELSNVDQFFEWGVRLMGPAHFHDNELGGSASGVRKGPITGFERRVIERMEELGILLDLAHSSPKLFDDAVNLAKKPMVVSHGGVRGVADNPRNLSDEQVKKVADKGGLVGIGFWHVAIGESSARAIARAARHIAKVGGVESVAMGSDFDGLVKTPFDVRGMPNVTEALGEEGFSFAEIEKIMGGNARRVVKETLPAG